MNYTQTKNMGIKMNFEKIYSILNNYDKNSVSAYISYISKLLNEKNKGNQKNPWINYKSEEYLSECFKKVVDDGLIFDGEHVTLQNTGVSYDYVAYKNKMLLIYPETLFDVQLVRAGDNFKFSKKSGLITYQHDINSPFSEAKVIGAYCVIKNKRGEFLTTLSAIELEKHRKVAKTDYIWANWTDEMNLKTVIKKACKQHFSDIYQVIETLDNEQYDIEQPLSISLQTKQAIEAISTIDELKEYYTKNKDANSGVLEDFTKACSGKSEVLKGKSNEKKLEQVQENENN